MKICEIRFERDVGCEIKPTKRECKLLQYIQSTCTGKSSIQHVLDIEHIGLKVSSKHDCRYFATCLQHVVSIRDDQEVVKFWFNSHEKEWEPLVCL